MKIHLQKCAGRSLVLWFWFFATLFAISPLFAQKVSIEFDQGADFSRYRTFAIRDGRLSSRSPALNSDLVRQRIDNDIRRYLSAKGLSEVAGRPGLNVVYQLGS